MTHELPLRGIRVVDFSRVLAGPHCAKTLLDLGADVIKIEPPSGDLSRKAFPGDGEISGYYAQQNAGKRNISIDLNVPGARQIAEDLCMRADVIIENFRPGALGAFDLDYKTVAALNPRVVYASSSGYGQHGPWRHRSAYAPTIEAETGISANTSTQFGFSDVTRTDALSHADVYAGLHATIAILAALADRERTGRGRYIDIAMAAVMLSINERFHADLSGVDLGAERPILGAADAPFFIGPGGERFAGALSLVGSITFPFYVAAMRRPDLAEDPRFLTPELREQHLPDLHRIVQDWIRTFPNMAALDAQLDEARIASGQVRTIQEFAETDWAKSWPAIRHVSDRKGNEISIPGRPWKFDEQIVEDVDLVVAYRGEHNQSVLHELGYTSDQITQLIESGALVFAKPIAASTEDGHDDPQLNMSTSPASSATIPAIKELNPTTNVNL